MKSKEKLAIDYIFFRFPSHYAIALVPVLGGIITVLSSKYNDQVISNNHWELTRLNRQHMIETYLFYSKFLLIFIISFYISYRWTLMLRDGTYGFWLTQQVRRSSFFVHAIIRFTLEIYFGLTLGLALLYYPAGVAITFTDLLFLSSLLLVNVLLIVSSSILISELIPSEEIAAIFFLLINSLNLILNTQQSNILHIIFRGDLHFQNADRVLALILSALTSILLLVGSFVIHLRKSIEL